MRELSNADLALISGGNLPPSCSPGSMGNAAGIGAGAGAIGGMFLGPWGAAGGAIFGGAVGGLNQLMSCRADLVAK